MKCSTTAAPSIIKRMTTRQLIECFIESTKIVDAGTATPETFIIRGWLMDELDARDPAAFDAWAESDDLEDESLYTYFNC